MYSTYQQYQQRGGKLPESEYQANAQKASELIDYYTMGQAASAETMGPQLSACECDQGAASGIQSENVDGYSVSFSGQTEANAGVLSVMKRHLSFPVNLLVFSGWSFV